MSDRKFEKIRYKTADGIAEITIDKPSLNLLDKQVTREYLKALALAYTDQDIRVIV